MIDAWVGLGEMYLEQEKWAEAKAALERAISLAPDEGRLAHLLKEAEYHGPLVSSLFRVLVPDRGAKAVLKQDTLLYNDRSKVHEFNSEDLSVEKSALMAYQARLTAGTKVGVIQYFKKPTPGSTQYLVPAEPTDTIADAVSVEVLTGKYEGHGGLIFRQSFDHAKRKVPSSIEREVESARSTTSVPLEPALFNAKSSAGGMYPHPPYPSLALRKRLEGKLVLYVTVDQTGSPVSVEVKESSGHSVLDTHSADWVKNRWRWPARDAGDNRFFLVPFEYAIR